MSALLALSLQVLSCLGWGAGLLRLLGLTRCTAPGTRGILSFALGVGLLGWLVFFLGLAGMLTPGWLAALLLIGAAGLPFLDWRALAATDKLDSWGWTLVVLIGGVLFLDLAEALSPPADADTLAYHFNAPKLFLERGSLLFILRPLDGAIPYLTQMTFLPVLALGGERAMTLWTMATGWAAGALVYILVREVLTRNWGLALALIFLTLPAVIYGAGTGQVEVRMTLFALLSGWAVARALSTGNPRFALLAGLATGFYIGSKYIGLLFAAVCGIALLMQKRWFLHGLLFGLAALAMGSQWYVWNAVHTGDPFFPMLFQWLGRDDLVLWTQAQNDFFGQNFLKNERVFDRTPLNFLLYPFLVTLDAPAATEGRRIGLGPFGLVLLPFALAGVWAFRARLRNSAVSTYALLALLFYVLWFFSGPSQRVRHLLTVFPFLMICFTVAAVRFTDTRQLRAPLLAAMVAVIALQFAGATVFGLKYVRYVLGSETREAYLTRSLSGYSVVPWINAHLSKSDLLFHSERQIMYYLDIPNLFVSPYTQGVVDLAPTAKEPQEFLDALHTLGVTHLLLPADQWKQWRSGGERQWDNCFHSLKTFEVEKFQSRTLSALAPSRFLFELIAVADGACGLSRPDQPPGESQKRP
ncbi:hypothetical protein JCM17960_14240 [Magnetospira thiophila]